MRLEPSVRQVFAVIAAFASLTLACEDKPAPQASKAEAGVADKYASADPKLEKAIQAASSASATSTSGPPASGIFEVAVANQRHPKGAPTKVDLISDGSDPKVSLMPGTADGSADAAKATSYGPAAMQFVKELGPRVVVSIDFGMIIGPSKGDGNPDGLSANIVRAASSKQQMGQLPPGFDKELAALQGTEVRLGVAPDGKETDLQLRSGKSANPDLERLAEDAAEQLVFATVPLPSKPVGAGAQWIAETRMPLSGVDAITYRAFRVKSIENNRIQLTVQIEAYSVGHEVSLQGVPKDATLEVFQTSAKGDLDLVRGEMLARKAEMQQVIVLGFSQAGAQGQQQAKDPSQMLQAQLKSQATFVRGDDLRAAMKQP